MLDSKYQQLPNENWRDYGIRLIGILLDQRPDDLEWQDIVDALGLKIHRDSLRKAQNTEFGGYAIYKYMLGKMDELKAKQADDSKYLEELKQARRELENEKYKIRDERNELRRLQREESRRESFADLVKRIIQENVEPICDEVCVRENNLSIKDSSTLIIPVSDVHTGVVCKNAWNNYDTKELICRLKEYFNKICEIKERHKSDYAVIVLGGDLISGIIHRNLRLENNEDVVRQIKTISTYLSNFVRDLANQFVDISIYSVSGNHSRVMTDKEDSLKGEELDSLVPFYMQANLQNYKNVHIYTENSVDDTMVCFKVYDKLWYAVHGTYDNPISVVQNLTMMTGVKPDGILIGHRHSNAMLSIYDTKVVQSGCMSGVDNYAIQKRLSNTAEQFIVVATPNKTIECLYDIQLSESSINSVAKSLASSS